jgi:hypothetical protein
MVWQVRVRPDVLWIWSQSLPWRKIRIDRIRLPPYHATQRLEGRAHFQCGRNTGDVEESHSPGQHQEWSGLRCQVSSAGFLEEDCNIAFAQYGR